MALSDHQALTMALTRDASGKIAAAERDQAIQLAVQRYSIDRPVVAVEDLVTTAANLVPLPASWQADFSALLRLEHPIGDWPPALIPNEEICLYRAPSGESFMIRCGIAAGATVRASYTQAHRVDNGHDTVPIKDREAVDSYAASINLDQLAAFFAGKADPSIAADSVNQPTRSQDYANRARTLRARYFTHLGIDPTGTLKAAGTVIELESRRGLTHRRTVAR
jgi:hypothetical protein